MLPLQLYANHLARYEEQEGSWWLYIQKEYPERVPLELWQSMVPSGGGVPGTPLPI